MSTMTLYNKFRVVPDEAKKTIQGGKLKGFTDINPMWRIKMLTEEFGECGFGWYYDEVDRWKEGCDNEVVCFVKIHLYIKRGGEWSAPIVGIGGSKLITPVNNGARIDVSDEAYKMALTDAISIACKALGMAADVYFANDRTKYDVQPAQPSAPVVVNSRREAQARAKRAEQPYVALSPENFNAMIAKYAQGIPSMTGEDYRTAWINFTHAKEEHIKMFDEAVVNYRINNNL